MYHDADGTPAETVVALEGSGLAVTLEGLPLGDLVANALLSLDTLAEGQLSFSGAIPRALSGKIFGLSLANAAVSYAPPNDKVSE